MNINSVVLSGRVTKDPEVRDTSSGNQMATFTLAVNRMKKPGQERADADFINVVAFGKTAEMVGQYLVKGQAAIVNGRLQIDRRENQGGTTYYTNVVANQVEFGAKPQGQGESRQQASRPAPRREAPAESFADDDLPF